TGRTPFAGRSAEQVFDQHLHAPVPSLASRIPEHLVPPGLDAVLARALAKEPRKRYQSMRELAAAIEQVGSSSSIRRLFGARRSGDGLDTPPRESDVEAPTLRSRVANTPIPDPSDIHVSIAIEFS